MKPYLVSKHPSSCFHVAEQKFEDLVMALADLNGSDEYNRMDTKIAAYLNACSVQYKVVRRNMPEVVE